MTIEDQWAAIEAGTVRVGRLDSGQMAPTRTPSDLARRSADALRRRPRGKPDDGYRRETFALEREAARAQARAMFRRYPKAAYMTEIEHWRELPDGRIEFTMRRLPSAD
jgi:hypothetical protein